MKRLVLILVCIGCGKSTGFGPPTGDAEGLPSQQGTGLDTGDPSGPGDGDGDGDGDDTGSSSTDDTGMSTDADADADADADTDADADADTDTAAPAIEGTGYGTGDTAYNLISTDQTGTPFALHDRVGSKIVLVVANLDIATTIDTLENFQSIASDHSDVTYAAFIGRDATGAQCNQACAASVQSTYGFSPVLWDTNMTTHDVWSERLNTRTYLIDTSMVIQWRKNGTVNATLADDKLDDLE